MSTLGTNNLTWLDYAAMVGDNGQTLSIVEMMDAVNDIIGDAAMVEGNTLTGHKVSLRTKIPAGTWRKINRGVGKEVAKEQAIEFTSGVIESRSEVDELLVNIAKNKAEFRLRQAKAFIEGMSQTLASTLIYGDVEVNPERFTGIVPFYSSLSGVSKNQIFDAGGTGSDNTSLWLICWQDDYMCTFFASGLAGAKAGIERNDKGLEPVKDSDSNTYYAFVEQFRAHLGFVCADYRSAARIANIDVSDLLTAGDAADASANLLKLAVRAKNQIWNPGAGRCAWYCNRDVKTALDIKALNKSNALISIAQDIRGDGVVKPFVNPGDTMLLGYPVHRVDAILSTEDRVV